MRSWGKKIYRDIDGARCFNVMEIDGDLDELHVKPRCPGTDGSMFNVIDDLRVFPQCHPHPPRNKDVPTSPNKALLRPHFLGGGGIGGGTLKFPW